LITNRLRDDKFDIRMLPLRQVLSTSSLAINMSTSRRSHKITLRGMPVNADGDALPNDTPPLPTTTQPVAALVTVAQANPQTASPFCSLPPELRNIIYAYAFAPNVETPANEDPLLIELNELATIAPSNALLLTCRQIEQEAKGLYRNAYQTFWQEDPILTVDLSDDWEDGDLRKERHFEVLDLLDETFLFPELRDEQVDAIKDLVITVRSDIANFKLHLWERIHHSTKYWVEVLNASRWPTDSARNVAYAESFVRTLLEISRGPHDSEGIGPYLYNAEAHFHIGARGRSGRRYKTMSARKELREKLTAKRAVMTANPTNARSCVKKRQLHAVLEHCWIVFRARRAI
jgi:hypothetical protein